MSGKRFDAVFIDFYGTICGGDRAAVERACGRIVRAFGIDMSAGDFAILWGERFFDVIEDSNRDAFRTLYECEILSLRETLRPLVQGDSDACGYVADLEDYWCSAPIHDDAVEFLANIDLPTCCVSNADSVPLMKAIEECGLRFDAVITSEDARCYKPDPRIFRLAVETLGVDPDRVIHIGDSLHSDVGGAAKLGITTTWVRRDQRIHDVGDCKPNYTIASLTDAMSLLC